MTNSVYPSPSACFQSVDGVKTDLETKLISEVQWRESLQADLAKERERGEEVSQTID